MKKLLIVAVLSGLSNFAHADFSEIPAFVKKQMKGDVEFSEAQINVRVIKAEPLKNAHFNTVFAQYAQKAIGMLDVNMKYFSAMSEANNRRELYERVENLWSKEVVATKQQPFFCELLVEKKFKNPAERRALCLTRTLKIVRKVANSNAESTSFGFIQGDYYGTWKSFLLYGFNYVSDTAVEVEFDVMHEI